MRTLLIPVDFTETAVNAVNYAAEYCRQFNYERIVLLKSFYDTLFDEVVMSAEYGGVGTDFRYVERKYADEWLQNLGRNLSLKNTEVEVVILASELPLMRAIAQVVREEKPRAILMGSDNNAYDNDSYVSGHVIQISKASTVNVIVVPAGQSFQPVEEVLIPVDNFTKGSLQWLNEVANRPFIGKMKLDILKFNLPIQNTEPQEEDEELHRQLAHTLYEVFTSPEVKAVDAVINFVKQHPVQMILALPGKYSFLYRLTHKLLDEAICRNTNKPVYIVKQFLS